MQYIEYVGIYCTEQRKLICWFYHPRIPTIKRQINRFSSQSRIKSTRPKSSPAIPQEQPAPAAPHAFKDSQRSLRLRWQLLIRTDLRTPHNSSQCCYVSHVYRIWAPSDASVPGKALPTPPIHSLKGTIPLLHRFYRSLLRTLGRYQSLFQIGRNLVPATLFPLGAGMLDLLAPICPVLWSNIDSIDYII